MPSIFMDRLEAMSMDYETTEASLQATRRTLMMMWVGSLVEPLIYAALPWLASTEQVGGPECCAGSTWKWGAYLLAVILAAASVFLRRYLLSDRRLEAFRGGDGAALVEASRRYLTTSLLSWGVNGCIPVGGVILLFTAGDTRTILVLAATAVVLNLLDYPQLDRFIERVENLG
jgi:hypothetical protein